MTRTTGQAAPFELVLVSRELIKGQQSTKDYNINLNLDDQLASQSNLKELKPEEWSNQQPDKDDYHKPDRSTRNHSLTGFSSFGSHNSNEFATFIQGKDAYLSNHRLKELCEEDVRSFAEQSDHIEGFMLTTPSSNAFGGFAASFLETVRDDFIKHPIFTTSIISNSHDWKRPDTERSIQQRLLNDALTLQSLEELSSIIMPIQPPSSWDDHPKWTRFLRDDVPKRDTYSQILTTHLQSANSELREVDGLNSVTSQLNWRGDNKIAHLEGASPLLPPEHLEGPQGVQILKDSFKDFSVFPSSHGRKKKTARSGDPELRKPFAQYSIVRGYEDEELQRLGTVLEGTTALVEPLSVWVALPDPYPVLPSALPIYRSLIPTGRPLVIAPPPNPDPLSPAGLFGLPDPLFPTASTYFVQPRSVPILTTLSTSPSARFWLSHLSLGVKELVRVRSPFLWEYENGEYGIGRDGINECRERLETLADNYAEAHGTGRESGSESDGLDEDEHFPEEESDLDI
ncbi:hypothetical protein T439DRAFT_321787 [Meredithblackwellia eburnea MCA 4105]